MDELKDMKLDDSLTDMDAEVENQEKKECVENSEDASSVGVEAKDSEASEAGDAGDADIADADADADIPVMLKPDQIPEALSDRKLSLDSALERAAVQTVGLPMDQRLGMHDRELSLMLKTRGRALSEALMTIAGTRQRSGRLWLTCAATFILIILFIIQVYYRHRELNLGYDLSAAISQREALLEENRKLRIELRVLSRRERLEPLAGKQLGMSNFKPEQVLILDMEKRGRPAAKAGNRSDGLDQVRRIGKE